ncbi:unnamed protein product [Closterium sp. NIES-53]
MPRKVSAEKYTRAPHCPALPRACHPALPCARSPHTAGPVPCTAATALTSPLLPVRQCCLRAAAPAAPALLLPMRHYCPHTAIAIARVSHHRYCCRLCAATSLAPHVCAVCAVVGAPPASVTRDDVSLFEHTSGSLTAPATPAEPATHAEEEVQQQYWADCVACTRWTARDATAQLAVCAHLQLDLRAHIRQVTSAQAFYDVVVRRYSSPSAAAAAVESHSTTAVS